MADENAHLLKQLEGGVNESTEVRVAYCSNIVRSHPVCRKAAASSTACRTHFDANVNAKEEMRTARRIRHL